MIELDQEQYEDLLQQAKDASKRQVLIPGCERVYLTSNGRYRVYLSGTGMSRTMDTLQEAVQWRESAMLRGLRVVRNTKDMPDEQYEACVAARCHYTMDVYKEGQKIPTRVCANKYGAPCKLEEMEKEI